MDNESWKVGVLFSETGVTGAIEQTQRVATLLAIDEINAAGGVGGKLLQPVCYDPQSRPHLYRDLALKLCDDDGVRVVFGCHMSSTRKAALPVIEARGALLFYPTLYEGFEYSRHCVYTGAAPNQNSVQLVDYLTTHYGKRVFLVGSNYVYPYESNRIIANLFRHAGGQVLDELYVPLELGSDDIDKVIARIGIAQPDVVYSTVVGDGIIPFYTAYHQAGFDARRIPIASQSTSEADVIRMPATVAQGTITAAPFFASLDTPKAQAFVNAFTKAAKAPCQPTAPAEAAYFQVHLFAAALAKAASDRIADLLPALYQVSFEAPQGLVQVDEGTNHTHLWPRVARVTASGTYEVVYDPAVRVAPDPFMLDYRTDPPEGNGHDDDAIDEDEDDLCL